MRLDDEREAELRELVDRLDGLVPRDGAHLTILADTDGNRTVGNRVAYLRLGVELLAAALHPLADSDAAPARIAPKVDYLLTEGSARAFDVCELDESIGSRPPARSGLGFAGQLVAGVVLVLTLILLFIGVSVMWRWVFG
jgi:hypothetical protein